MEEMINIPVCFFCNNYNDDTKGCPAYPDGIPDEVLASTKWGESDCGNGVGFCESPQSNE